MCFFFCFLVNGLLLFEFLHTTYIQCRVFHHFMSFLMPFFFLSIFFCLSSNSLQCTNARFAQQIQTNQNKTKVEKQKNPFAIIFYYISMSDARFCRVLIYFDFINVYHHQWMNPHTRAHSPKEWKELSTLAAISFQCNNLPHAFVR